MNLRNSCRTTDKDNLVNISFLHIRLLENICYWLKSLLEDFSTKFLELSPSDSLTEVKAIDDTLDGDFDGGNTG